MFTFVFSLFLLILTALYCQKILFFYRGLFRLNPGHADWQPTVTVIIPARNEEENIRSCLDSLLRQDYPVEKFQIIVVDDGSTDQTGEVVRTYVSKYRNVTLIPTDDHPTNPAPKKTAIQQGIANSDGEVIATMDADCRVGPTWLREVIRHFEPEVGMVAGLLAFDRQAETNLFHKLQSLEFIGLVAAGAGSLGWGQPLIANGANLAYRRVAFTDIGGFVGIDRVASGDDVLLMQKLHANGKWKIRLAASADAIVHTQPQKDLRAFLNQRKRWAAKSQHFPGRSTVFFLASVYLLYFSFLVAVPISCLNLSLFPLPIFLLTCKAVVDFLLVTKGCSLMQRRDLLKYFPLAEVLQVPYVLYAGAAGLLGSFQWKGRKYHGGWKSLRNSK